MSVATRFRSLYEVSSLLPLAVDVARHVHPAEPWLLTRPEFNDNRASAGHPGAPTAETISRRLGMAWSLVLEVGLDPARCGT